MVFLSGKNDKETLKINEIKNNKTAQNNSNKRVAFTYGVFRYTNIDILKTAKFISELE